MNEFKFIWSRFLFLEILILALHLAAFIESVELWQKTKCNEVQTNKQTDWLTNEEELTKHLYTTDL